MVCEALLSVAVLNHITRQQESLAHELAACVVLATCDSSKPERSLVFDQRADAGFVRQWKPIAGFQAGVNVNLVASQGGRGIAGNLIPHQEENPPLQLLELGRVHPGYVPGEWKAHDHLAFFGFCSLED